MYWVRCGGLGTDAVSMGLRLGSGVPGAGAAEGSGDSAHPSHQHRCSVWPKWCWNPFPGLRGDVSYPDPTWSVTTGRRLPLFRQARVACPLISCTGHTLHSLFTLSPPFFFQSHYAIVTRINNNLLQDRVNNAPVSLVPVTRILKQHMRANCFFRRRGRGTR